MKKYELTKETKTIGRVTLYRIKALRSFGNVKAGDLGGFVEKEENLSHKGNSWVYGNAEVYGNAKVYGNAWVYGNAEVCDNAEVRGPARICSGEDYLCFQGLGSLSRNITFFKCKDGDIRVSCDCFSGDLGAFETKVKETHGNRKYAKEYLACIEVVKIHFEIN